MKRFLFINRNFQGTGEVCTSAIQIFTSLRELFAKLPESKIRLQCIAICFHVPGVGAKTVKEKASF
jgi:hypothetical protein